LLLDCVPEYLSDELERSVRLLIVAGCLIGADRLKNFERCNFGNRAVAELPVDRSQEPFSLADRGLRQPPRLFLAM
jgi:hypothetical protein